MRTSRSTVYVIVQFFLLAAYLLPVRLFSWPPGEWVSSFGSFLMVFGAVPIVIAMLQLRHQFSPFPAPARGGGLITTGAFSVSRHPIYLGVMIMGLGLVLFTGSGYRLLLTALLAVLFTLKSTYEEQLLTASFPAYTAYRKRVNRFFTLRWATWP